MARTAQAWVWRQPLVPAAGAFVLGLAVGRSINVPPVWLVAAAFFAWAFWALAEAAAWRGAGALLAGAILFAGAATWGINQDALEPASIARFARSTEAPVTARVRVTVPPANVGRGGAVWVGRTESVLTQRGWRPASGWVRVKTRDTVSRGDLLELHGWLSTPPEPENPGAMDLRTMLAADRVFAQIRVPRAMGALVIDRGSGGESGLVRLRGFLRGKLLEHTAREDVEAGYAMEALLLGVREPVIDDITRAFSAAGVAHLLAISGAHVVFVAACVWWLLRWMPLRPRWRELLVAAAVIGYVLATPCGPPVIRAAVAVVMVVIARMLGRPRINLNMLAAALLVVLLWRPADLLDAGLQLSFTGTAALIIFAARAYAALFGAWLDREKTLARLADTRLARMQVRLLQTLCALLVANAIGVASTMPLVAFHFKQINPLGVLTGMAALPFVALAMLAAALQVAVEIISTTAAAWIAPLTAAAGRMMVWVVQHLAMIPGSAVSLRAPAWWVVAAIFLVWIAWAGRRHIGISRAAVLNLAVAAAVLVAGWYTWTSPQGALRIEVLRVGIGSAMVLRMPDGAVWVVDAGSREVAAPMERALMPALRDAGAGRVAGILLMGLDEVHARDAGPVIARYRPAAVVTPAAVWGQRLYTRAGGEVEATARNVTLLTRGNSVTIDGARVTLAATGIVMWEFAGRRVAMVDGKALSGMLQWVDGAPPCDALILTGAPARGMAELLARVRCPVVRAGHTVSAGPDGVSVAAF